jgi:hypothetical protein
MPNCVQTARRERGRRRLRNVHGDRGVAGVTLGTATATTGGGIAAGSGTGPTRVKVDGSRRKGGGTTATRKSIATAPALRGGGGTAGKVRPGATDTALAHPRTTKRGRSAVGGGDARRDRGAGTLVGTTSGALGVEVTQPPSGIAHVLPTTRAIAHGGIDCVGAPGAPVQVVLLMWIPARAVNDTQIAVTIRTEDGTDHAHFRAPLIRRLAPKRYQRAWMLGISRLVAREHPVSLCR